MDKNMIEKLKQGDFSKVKLNQWFNHNYIEYITATLEGCDKNLDYDMLYFISMYAKHMFFKTNGSNKSNDIITFEACKTLLKQIIIVGSKHPEVYSPVLKELMNFPDDIIRLYCCAYYDYNPYFYDSCKRIRKVAKIRQEFKNKWIQISKNEQELEQIKFLVSALEKGVIQMESFYTFQENDELTPIKFNSLLFEWLNPNINPNSMNFDVDILYTIPDKRILACTINEWIKNGTIKFNEGMRPACFDMHLDDLIMDIQEIIETHPSLKRTKNPTNPRI